MSSNGRMGRNPFQKKAPREVAEEAPTPEQSAPAAELQEALPEVNVEAVSLPSEAVQFISAPSQIQDVPELDSDSEVPSWMKAVAVTYRVALLTRFGAQVAVSEAQQFLHGRLRQHQQAKRHGRV
jgi:hypothetical protein